VILFGKNNILFRKEKLVPKEKNNYFKRKRVEGET